jgi:N-acetylglucosamine kinase-like BadF-type ATPase
LRAVLGIDAGATKTHALVASGEGAILGFAEGQCGNWERVGLEAAGAVYVQTAREALSIAGLSAERLSGGGYGLAGLDWPSDHERLRPLIERLGVGGPQVLVNDAFVALWAGTGDGCGVVVIAGTGTTVAGRNRAGDEARTLGMGYPFGDFGGAGDMVRAAVYAIATAYTGRGAPTALSDRFVQLTGSRNAGDLLERVARRSLELDAAMAPQVLDAAQGGDEVALGIVRRAGRELGENAVAIIRRLGLEGETFDVVLAGGVLRAGNRTMLDALEEVVRQAAPLAHLALLTEPPVVGAVLLAFEAVGTPLSGDSHCRLREEAENLQ